MDRAFDLHRTIASLHQARVSLALETADLCFLISLRERADRLSLASFEEDALVDVFMQVCELTDPGAENPRKRATHAIQRLREQRLLARVDGAGLIRAGEYSLTRLATAVVDFYLADDALTRDSLTVLTKTLLSQLADIKASASRARDDADWRRAVVEPLRVTVADLVSGIERRQRGLDTQQEEVRGRIATLLQSDWFGAVGDCEALLEQTSTTLRELNEVLLQDAVHLQALLQDIEQLAADFPHAPAEQAAQRVAEHVDRVSAWGSDRLRAWSDYYQYVHRYLRDVVRLDPDRAVSQRLRDQLASWLDRPFALGLAHAPSIRLLREVDARAERPPVTRPRRDLEAPLEHVAPHDARAALQERVLACLRSGVTSLSAVVSRVLPEVPERDRYRAAGSVTATVGRDPRARSAVVRPWVQVAGDLQLEDWSLDDQEPSR